jgi:hypothetical protein
LFVFDTEKTQSDVSGKKKTVVGSKARGINK